MRARSFFYVSAGLFLLAAAYGLGTRQATAQVGGGFAGISAVGTGTVAITAGGDVWARNAIPASECPANNPQIVWTTCFGSGGSTPDTGWIYMGNVLGGTVAVDKGSIGEMKSNYRE